MQLRELSEDNLTKKDEERLWLKKSKCPGGSDASKILSVKGTLRGFHYFDMYRIKRGTLVQTQGYINLP